MNERFGTSRVRWTWVLVGALSICGNGRSLFAQRREYDDAPDYQRAPTQSGDWRYEAPRDAGRARDLDNEEPVESRRYETINRARPTYQQPPRRVATADRRPGSYNERPASYERGPQLPERYAAPRDQVRADNRAPRGARPAYDDRSPPRDERYVAREDRYATHDDRDMDHAGHDHAGHDHSARPARNYDDQVRPVKYQWRASREQAQRAQLSEAPVYRPGADESPNLGVMPKRDLLEAPVPRLANRPRYRPTTMNSEYELPPAVAPQPQAEYLPGPGRNSAGYSSGAPQVTYPDGGAPVYQEGGYPDDGYGPDGFTDGYGPEDDGYYHDGGPATYDEFGRPLYLTPCPYCGECCGGISCHHRWLDESSVFAGVHAFKGGLDQGQNGNFGFQEGVNFAGALWHQYGIGYQIGAEFVQSDLSGSNIANAFNNSRQQTFLTAGLYHRPMCGQGWQGGAVYDWLDDRFYQRTRFQQVRAEASYIFSNGNELGYWGAFATGSNQTQLVNGTLLTFSSVNQNAFFYRKNFANGDQFRIWGGFVGNSGGLVGADHRIHMSNNWDLMGGFNYLIPGSSKDGAAATQEAWGIALNLVWYPTRPTCGTHNGPFRSLFSVADNNWLMVREKK